MKVNTEFHKRFSWNLMDSFHQILKIAKIRSCKQCSFVFERINSKCESIYTCYVESESSPLLNRANPRPGALLPIKIRQSGIRKVFFLDRSFGNKMRRLLSDRSWSNSYRKSFPWKGTSPFILNADF